MSEDYELVSDYVGRNKESFLMACSIADKINSIRLERRRIILNIVLSKLTEYAESKNYIIRHDLTGNQHSFIEFYKPSWEGLKVCIRMEAELKNLQGWFYGIVKGNKETPFLGNITEIQENESNKFYFELKKQSKLPKSSSWWLGYGLYPQKYRYLDDEMLAESLSTDGMQEICSIMLQPLFDLADNTE